MIPLEKPGSPQEILEHHGVLGMKWGVRRSQGTREFHSKFTTPEARAQEIHRARAQVSSNKAGGKQSSTYDKATALRFTRGEKFVTAALYSLAPTVVVPAGAAGYTAVKVGKRRAIQS